MKYHYQFFEREYLPIIPLAIKGKKEWVDFNVYIDTGTSFCLFPANVAEILDIPLEKGDVKKVVLGDGNTLTVYIHHLPISLAGKEFMAPIGFSKGLGINFAIIGRKGIFENFIICFNEKEKWIGFEAVN